MGPPMHRPRIDWQAERDRIDLAAVATDLLGPAPGRRGERGRKLWWRCPLHDDRNPSFCVDPGKASWRCYGCGEHGDAPALVMRIRGVSFPEAIAELTGASAPSQGSRPRPTPRPAAEPEPRTTGIPEADARALVEDAERRLWTPEGADALDYLTGPQRRLSVETIRAARLGWTPGVRVPRKGGDGTYPAEGIVMPWFDGDRLTLVKIRQPEGRKPKYAEAFKNVVRHVGIYPGRRTIQAGRPLVIAEGEFDALLLGQELAGLAPVVTLGSASNRPNPAILGRMLAAAPWLIATDADGAGDDAATDWPGRSRRVRPPDLVPHPADGAVKPKTDWTDLAAFGVDLRRWWSDILAGNDHPPLFSRDELAGWRWGPAADDPEPGIIIP